jgi:hypothetical protein
LTLICEGKNASGNFKEFSWLIQIQIKTFIYYKAKTEEHVALLVSNAAATW